MTIKEIETRSGLTRANIRFYEKERFISPAREKNGYRNYSESDLTELERIKLLRALDVPLEQIHSVQSGETDLHTLLAHHLTQLETEQERIQTARSVCRQLCQDGADYQTLNALPYLTALRTDESPKLNHDQVAKVRAPWTRFFARWMDTMLCVLLFHLLAAPFPGFNLTDPDRTDLRLLTGLCSLLLMLVLEPLFLHLTGTTPGKWMLGLRVTDREDGRLTYQAAWMRTLSVLRYGSGFGLPVYSWYRLWKSCRSCNDGQTLPWEKDTILVQRTNRMPLRVSGGVLCTVLILLGEAGVLYSQTIPRHLGDLTPEEFADNFNRAAVYYGVTDPHSRQALRLSEELEWENAQPDFIYDDNDILPAFVPITEDGQLTGLRLSYDNPDTMLSSSFFYLTDLRVLAISSFVRGRDLFPAALRDSMALMEQLADQPLSDFVKEINGVRISNHVVCSGYHQDIPGLPVPREGVEHHFQLDFSMELVG